MNPDELDCLLAKLSESNPTEIVAAGEISDVNGSTLQYEIRRGWDPIAALKCDQSWGTFNVQLMDFIHSQNYSEEELSDTLNAIQIDDEHWQWLAKSALHRAKQYEWFFYWVNGIVQGACLIYHPMDGELEEGQIFYIEYIAVAPWNRTNPMQPRVLKGVGTALIRAAMTFAQVTLGLKPGFSLHALEKAVPFYKNLGMEPLPELDKPNLYYFEMASQTASAYVVKP